MLLQWGISSSPPFRRERPPPDPNFCFLFIFSSSQDTSPKEPRGKCRSQYLLYSVYIILFLVFIRLLEISRFNNSSGVLLVEFPLFIYIVYNRPFKACYSNSFFFFVFLLQCQSLEFVFYIFHLHLYNEILKFWWEGHKHWRGKMLLFLNYYQW